MNKPLYRVPGYLGLRNLIKAVSEAHPAVTEFKSGTNLDDTTHNNYPLAFLESDSISETEGHNETFTIALSIADRMRDDSSEDEYLKGHSKVDQILSEIHYKLNQISPIIKVSNNLRKLPYRNLGKDSQIVVRGEFTMSIVRQTAQSTTPFDHTKLQEFLDTLPLQ